MQIHISSRHLKLTGAIQAYVAQKVSHLEHLTEDIIGAHVVLMHDENRAPAKAFCVKIHLGVPGPDIHIEEHNADMYAAVDLAVEKLARQLRKRKTKTVTARKHKLQVARETEKRGYRR
ncbi:MAG: ribosome-associated translation inhibitor RaiA [Verrucomicrobiales bacterium]|jgi:putative sigma-54 modulation protein|nr:ribosome-associated translation inhibitor RaiA [Verrucomicrobiales bacterium]